jgi:hypothetical protein
MSATSLTHHENGLPRRMTEAELLVLVRDLASQGARVTFRRHALQRLDERSVTTDQVLRVLRRGEVVRGPDWDNAERNWRFTMRALTAGEEVSVGAAIDVEQLMGTVVVVITVILE